MQLLCLCNQAFGKRDKKRGDTQESRLQTPFRVTEVGLHPVGAITVKDIQYNITLALSLPIKYSN
jgi:hypothetical protein